MTEGMSHTTAPGSDEARKIGCTCAVIDNHYGRGYHGRSGVYVVNEDCRVHGSRADDLSERAAIAKAEGSAE